MALPTVQFALDLVGLVKHLPLQRPPLSSGCYSEPSSEVVKNTRSNESTPNGRGPRTNLHGSQRESGGKEGRRTPKGFPPTPARCHFHRVTLQSRPAFLKHRERPLCDTAARQDLLLLSDQFLPTAALRSTFALRSLTGRLSQKEFDVTDDVPTRWYSTRHRRALPEHTCFPTKLLSTMKTIAISKPPEGPESPLQGCFHRSDSTDEPKPRSTRSGGSCTPSQLTPLSSNPY
ncbi:uncharacterized protein LOC129209385 [Grus americana]|uniref:uncharacterized protein LOC129209385 n=1 Tax=Grus americana TaxID=9117 RepID=UPI0024088ACA|nr:uncharacterized protein LOC129209385 [Grus americana]